LIQKHRSNYSPSEFFNGISSPAKRICYSNFLQTNFQQFFVTAIFCKQTLQQFFANKLCYSNFLQTNFENKLSCMKQLQNELIKKIVFGKYISKQKRGSYKAEF